MESFDAEKAGTIELDPAARDKLSDPLAALEHGGEDKRRAVATFTQVQALQEESKARHKCVAAGAALGRGWAGCEAGAAGRHTLAAHLLTHAGPGPLPLPPRPHRDNYAINKQLRRQMRVARKEEAAADARRRQLGLPDAVTLLPLTKGDELLAASQHFGGNFDAARKHSRRAVAKQSIFSAGAVAAAAAARQTKRPAGGGSSSAAAAATAGPGLGGGHSSAAAKQRRLAPNVKLRLTDPFA